tara:strand:- start:223 stop:339 length:117 start_codon:yes stop_codon:yes gene_type:complete
MKQQINEPVPASLIIKKSNLKSFPLTINWVILKTDDAE